MANPGSGVGSKFVSVNLNKSYGQPRSSSSNASRVRPINHVGGGGGMVVLSRPRSTLSGGAKGTPRLSVPPPLNLPSLRKEHERFDLSASGSSVGGGNTGSGSGIASSTMGWTKPAISSALLEKDADGDHPAFGRPGSGGQRVGSPGEGDVRSSGNVYMPPAARSGMAGQQLVAAPAQAIPSVEKAVVLKGEDFPSLHATLSSLTTHAQKQKDGLHQKQKQRLSEAASNEKMETCNSHSPVHMRPQLGSSRLTYNSNSHESKESDRRTSGFSMGEPSWKQDRCLPGPLPLVRLCHTSDWADDERDTGHGIADRDRDYGSSRVESVRERDFAMPRSGLPRPLVQNVAEGWGLRDAEAGKVLSREVQKVDTFGRAPSREGRDGSSWRFSPLPKDGFGPQETGIDRNGATVRPFVPNRETSKDNKFGDVSYGGSVRDGFGSMGNGNQDSRYPRRDSGYGLPGQNGSHAAEAFNGRDIEQNTRGRYGEASNRYRGDVFQSSSITKSSLSLGSKGLPMNDPILNFTKEKRLFRNSGKPYAEDAFMGDFDGKDPFYGGLVGDVKLFKRKKDVIKQADFPDPVRESFEAELERVQKMQEQERQRVAEEQARAIELARKEEEERQRLAREEEERRRRLEEEAREAARRAEQERLESIRRAEELKLAREEEKRRILLEEERRKEAAKQKLLELEARIAQRQAEAAKDDKFTTFTGDERMLGAAKEGDISRLPDGVWEDGEQLVERITSSASSDSSSMNRPSEMGSRPHSSRDGNSGFLDRGKYSNSWKRDVFENGNNSSFLFHDQDNGYRSPRRDVFGAGRVLPRKDLYGGPGMGSSRTSPRIGMPESHMPDDFSNLRGHRWNLSGDVDHYSRISEIDSEFPDNSMDKFGDIGWGQGRSRSSTHSPYAERFSQNSEIDGFSSFGRSRLSMRQPRVLPPPLPSMHRNSLRPDSEHPGPSAFLGNESRYQHASYESGYRESIGQPGMMASAQEETIPQEPKEEKHVTGCDSQSSLSVSSPPNSPTHLSHDDMDECGDSTLLGASEDGKHVALSDDEHIVSVSEAENANTVIAPREASPADDEDWATGDNKELQEQEEYDEEEEGYQEEEEVHEGDDENLDLSQEFEELHLEEQDASEKINQLVLGFDEGVEVAMPSGGECERPSTDCREAVGRQTLSAVVAHESESLDKLVGNEQGLPSENYFPEASMESSDKMIQETERAPKNFVIRPENAPSSSGVSATHQLNSVEAPNSSLLGQQPVTCAVNMSLSQPILSTVSSISSQSEVSPVNLQFGLFSGPSLIPSPVPAIQIGSIQMPLHLHPQVGPSLTQMHPSQSPVFQFGQLRYPSPISQGLLPLASQTVSFVSMNQNPSGPLHNQPTKDSSIQSPYAKDKMPPVLMDNQPGVVPELMNLSHESLVKEPNDSRAAGNADCDVPPQSRDSSLFGENRLSSESISQVESKGRHDNTAKRNYRSFSAKGDIPRHFQTNYTSSPPSSNERNLAGSKALGAIPGSKGKKFVYTVKNNASRSLFAASEASPVGSSGLQRRARRNIRRAEFRVRENVDRRQSEGVASSGPGQDDKSNFNGRMQGLSKSGGKKDAAVNKSTRTAVESESFLASGSFNSRVVNSESKMDKALGNTAVTASVSAEGLKASGNSEEDLDAPLQSGVVRVFKQPGIEAPSDEDDFIEVRSKRQVLNDRREQREKEIKAKSRVMKAPRKPRSTSQNIVVSSNSNRGATSLNVEMNRLEFVVTDGRGSVSGEVSLGLTTSIASPPLPPIGTPAVNQDVQSDTRSLHMKSRTTTNSAPPNLVAGLSFESKNGVLDNVTSSLGPWANVRINPQVMALTQTQLDEAMKPPRFDSHVPPVGDHVTVALEPGKPSTSVLNQDISFTSSASPVNSLLAGEKIQFGAVTSPTILIPSSRALSSGIGYGSCRSDVSTDRNLFATEGDCTMFFDKEKHPAESCIHLEDPEAEAEAAASAVAVAAISSDELVGSGLGTCSVSVSETKSFGAPDVAGLPSGEGVTANPQLSGQSRAEESLTVALPADLSVETPSLSLWPTLPSPQNSSGPMLSHFPGAPHSHFPCYEMNPMLGGPIFAFGPHDESASTQSQSQKSSTSGTGQLGAWQQCNSSVDSFYGPPAGFTGPFITPPGGIPGVQGPPHMVVYNHFAPVGQYGPVGLSFMGTAYIPSGKQPDWKHTPVSSSVGVSEGDISNHNMISGQHNPQAMPAPMQHLGPGSPLLPMASPLAMFDVSPFQSSAEIPVQARWSHMPASTLHSVPLSMPLHQVEGGLPSQFNHGLPVDSSTGKQFHESQSSMPPDNSRNFHVAADSAQLPDELGLVDSSDSPAQVATSRPASYSTTNGNSKVQCITKSSARSAVANASESGHGNSNSSGSSSGGSQSMGSSFKSQPTQQYLQPIGYMDQRGGFSHKTSSGGEWHHRRMGFQGRNQASGADKNFSAFKMKQIYVAKQAASGAATTSV